MQPSPPPPPEASTPLLVAVVGATATGKSDLALALAGALGGEVVNADASQLYRGMDIGTAKVPVTERLGIPHHQLDVLDLRDVASVAAYQREARADLDAVVGRCHLPVLVGGSGLYVRAALDRLDIPPTDAGVRERLQERTDREGASAAHARLAELDPKAAAAILPTNARRIVRALEVIELTGRPFSASLPERVYRRPTLALGLTEDLDVLDERIEARVHRMWAAGLIEEVQELLDRGLREGPTSAKAVGYVQAIAQLDGVLTQDEAIAATTAATRRLARRQRSWFGPDERIRWLRPPSSDRDAWHEQVVAAVRAVLAGDPWPADLG